MFKFAHIGLYVNIQLDTYHQQKHYRPYDSKKTASVNFVIHYKLHAVNKISANTVFARFHSVCGK